MSIQNTAKTSFIFSDGSAPVYSGDAQSNTTITDKITDLILIVKSSDKAILVQGDIAKQTVKITNNAPSQMTNVNFKDVMTSGATFVTGSVTIDGTSYNNYDVVSGFNIPAIQSGSTVIVTFDVKANDPITDANFENYANTTFEIKAPINPGKPLSYSLNSNVVNIDLVDATLIMTKLADRGYVISGDILEYTIIIANDTPFTATNIVFSDQIPQGTTFVTGSVNIDGLLYPAFNPSNSFPLADIVPNGSTTVKFKVEVM